MQMTSDDEPKLSQAVEDVLSAAFTPQTGVILDHLHAALGEKYRIAYDTDDTKTPLTNEGDQKAEVKSVGSPPCNTCHHFANGVETSTPTADFLVSAGKCQGCSIILQALDAVTDIQRPEFTSINIRRKEADDCWHFQDPKNVLNVECKQEGEEWGGMAIFGRKYVDSRPNNYQIYTPIGRFFATVETPRDWPKHTPEIW
jgi:hypothetical protein